MQTYRCLLIIFLVSIIALNASAIRTTDIAIDSLEARMDSISLGEVTVKAINVTRKGNEDHILITKSMRQGVRSAAEVLGRVQGVYYDPLTKAISYMGSKNVVILVDSVEKNEDYIKRLHHVRFDRIDIIDTPQGKYAEYDALINFHTRDLYEGYEGNVTADDIIATGKNNGDGNTLAQQDYSADFTYTREKLNLAVTGGYNQKRQGSTYYSSSEYPLNGLTETTLELPRKHPGNKNRGNESRLQMSADYDFNKKHSVSLLWNISLSDNHSTAFQRLRRTIASTGHSDITEALQNSRIRNTSNSVSAYYRGNLGQWQLFATASTAITGGDKNHDLSRSSGFRSIDNRNFRAYHTWGSMDLGRTFGRCYLFLSDYLIADNYRETSPTTGARLASTSVLRNISRLWMSYFASNAFSIQLSVGADIYRNSWNGLSRTHVNPRGSAFATWTPDNNVTLRAQYDLSTSAPAMSSTIDYGTFTDSLIYTTGNPLLDPRTIQKTMISLALWRSLTFRATYFHTNNDIFDIYSAGHGLRPDGIDGPFVREAPANGKGDDLSLALNFNKRFAGNFSLSLASSVTYMHAKSAGWSHAGWSRPQAEVNGGYFTSDGSFSCTLVYTLSDRFYVTPQNVARGLTDQLSIYLYKSLFKGAVDLSFIYYTPIHFASGDERALMVSDALIQRSWGNNRFRTDNRFRIAVAYRFQGGKSVRKYQYKTM